MKFNYLPLLIGLIYGSSIYAAPEDLFLQSDIFTEQISTPFKLTLGLDAVDETIDFFDIRENAGIQDNSTGDYRGAHVTAEYQFHPQWLLEGSYWYRELDYSQDTNTIHSLLLGIRYFPNFKINENSVLFFRTSVWNNEADELNKSSPTEVNQRTFNQVTVNQPQDLNFQLDTVFSHQISPMHQINIFTSLGYSEVEVKNLKIQAQSNGCLVNINIQSNNQFTGNLAKPCSIGNIPVTQLNVSGNANEYGIDIQKDLNYDSYYASLGGSWNWRYQNFESQLAYQYQHLWRNDIDDRVNNFGNQAIKDNHSLGAKFSYHFTSHVTAFIKGELYQHNFVGHIPFLYNAVTASHLDQRYGIATLGLTIYNF
ncbi:hypothetical protein B9T26_09615 [Acinetobacter sp. ANC 4169]|uniref:hypothetical protein n=1 Tax=Acinetobacter sp. ANC 4169 TaxID=1977879 RepID=UPI000A340B82|nr:hypothetical protein [Acinetobacter sp. ANC 4169]OTG72727.1 hypothetical protein B9T26_09615 [Acinetobacter sp. ANC 4169]